MSTSSKNEYTFLGLLNDTTESVAIDRIEIPIIQRDYVQGRSSAKEKLTGLLGDIKTAVDTSRPLGLNFVYGKKTARQFIPMDGQQRLTLLFLLHLYAFAEREDMTKILSKFTYRTRETSRMFIESLVGHRRDIFLPGTTPGKEIEDSGWFFPQWIHDPTIQSMIVVLNKIASLFPDKEKLAEALQKKLLTFKFLNMKNLGLEDTLYIKLNARGKPLTSFENFKAKLVERVEMLENEGCFAEIFNENQETSFAKKFERQLDGDWTDIFWNITNKQTPLSFDGFFLNFINNIRNNQPALASLNVGSSSSIDHIDENTCLALYETLQVLRVADLWDLHLKACIADDPFYRSRAMLYALTAYSIRTRENIPDDMGQWRLAFMEWKKGFDKWYRIIGNFVRNSDIRGWNFSHILRTIDILVANGPNIEEFFADSKIFEPIEKNLSGSSLQIREERLKAQLILQKNELFRETIENAERNPYFSGQLTGVLSFAGFVIDDTGDLEEKLQKFNRYWHLCDLIFRHEEAGLGIDGVLLRRALLTLGDFRLSDSWLKTFVVDNPNDNYSWKRIFSSDSESRRIFKNLFDILIDAHANSIEKIEKQLVKMIESSEIEPDDWRYHFIGKEEIASQQPLLPWDYIGKTQWRTYESGDQLFLISKGDTRSRHYELNAFLVYRYLRKKGKNVSLSHASSRQTCRIGEINISPEEILIVECINRQGLIIKRLDGQPLTPLFAGGNANDVIRYLEDRGGC